MYHSTHLTNIYVNFKKQNKIKKNLKNILWHMHIGHLSTCQQTTDHSSWASFHTRSRQCCWQMLRSGAVIGPSRWVFPHSAKSCQQTRTPERGPSRLCSHLLSHSPGDNRLSPGSRDAVYAHQYADPTGVYVACVNISRCAFKSDALELGNAGFLDFPAKLSL